MSSRSARSSLVVLLLVGVGVGTYLIQPRAGSTAAPAATPPPARADPPIAQITNAARDLKLITWSFDTTLDAQVVSDKWYGDATAQVRAPVRYQYGVDLSTLMPGDTIFDPAGNRFVFLVAPPRRLSVEVDIRKLEENLSVSGLRWKSRNADALDEARKTLSDRAKALVLADADEKRLRAISREQLEQHLSDVMHRAVPDATVAVRFAD